MHTTARSWGQATRNTYLEPSLSVGAVTGLRDSSDPASNSAMAFRGKMKVTQEFGAFSSCARPVLPDVGKNGHATVRVDSDFETMRSNITRTYRDMDYNDNDYYARQTRVQKSHHALTRLIFTWPRESTSLQGPPRTPSTSTQ
jgi:hypothetical protein